VRQRMSAVERRVPALAPVMRAGVAPAVIMHSIMQLHASAAQQEGAAHRTWAIVRRSVRSPCRSHSCACSHCWSYALRSPGCTTITWEERAGGGGMVQGSRSMRSLQTCTADTCMRLIVVSVHMDWELSRPHFSPPHPLVRHAPVQRPRCQQAEPPGRRWAAALMRPARSHQAAQPRPAQVTLEGVRSCAAAQQGNRATRSGAHACGHRSMCSIHRGHYASTCSAHQGAWWQAASHVVVQARHER
jgi:hypothetical protein